MTTRSARWLRRHQLVAAALVVAAVAIVVPLVVWILPALLTRKPAVTGAIDRHKAEASVRTGLVAAMVALGTAGTLAYNFKSFRLNQLGHLTNRFQDASKHMGDENPTVRLGGIEAMAMLADEWGDQRQRCVDVLCTYVRSSGDHTDRDSQRRALEVITERLRPGPTSWIGCDFDLTNAVFDFGAAFDDSSAHSVVVGASDFRDVSFSSGRFSFTAATFRGRVAFDGATFATTVTFAGASFESGCVSFDKAAFTRGAVDFSNVTFAEGTVQFENATFDKRCTVTFKPASLGDGGYVSFRGARFQPERPARAGVVSRLLHREPTVDGTDRNLVGVTFADAQFVRRGSDGDPMSFADAQFGTSVSFDHAKFDVPVTFDGACLCNATLSFTRAELWDDLTFHRVHGDGSTLQIDKETASDGGRIVLDRLPQTENCKICNVPVGTSVPAVEGGEQLEDACFHIE